MDSDDSKPGLSPQEKKSLSYARDRRNSYGENDKASRKAIPARKAGENRKVRRKATQAIGQVERVDEAAAAALESSLKHDIERIGGWTKAADMPLQDFIGLQARRRALRGAPPTRTKEPPR